MQCVSDAAGADESEPSPSFVLETQGAELLLIRHPYVKLGNEEENFSEQRKLLCDSALFI